MQDFDEYKHESIEIAKRCNEILAEQVLAVKEHTRVLVCIGEELQTISKLLKPGGVKDDLRHG
jgi:hypothetical protein